VPNRSVQVSGSNDSRPSTVGFTNGTDVFRHSVGEKANVRSLVWYNGQRKNTYRNTAVSNPLLHGFLAS